MPRHTPGEREEQLRRLIRERIIAGIHAGHYDIGDRLPTYRELAEEAGADLRNIARAYRALEAEGLVEIRGRSGVFVAPQERIGGKVLAETSRWLVGVLRGARTRHIRIPDFPDFVRRCIDTVEVRCAAVDYTEDQLSTICLELRRNFGLRCLPVLANQLGTPRAETSPAGIPEELLKADFLVTSTYHAAMLRPIADRMRKPLVIIRLHPETIRQLRGALAADGITLVHVDPHFLDRVRLLAGEHAERVHSVLARDHVAVRNLDRSGPLLISPAARQALPDIELPPSLVRGPLLCDESADEILELLIRFNLEAMRED